MDPSILTFRILGKTCVVALPSADPTDLRLRAKKRPGMGEGRREARLATQRMLFSGTFTGQKG
jgi:hypothetical protein